MLFKASLQAPFKAFQKSHFRCFWGCSFSHYRPHIQATLKRRWWCWSKGLQAPFSNAIQAPILSIIQPHSEHHSGTHSSIIQAFISAPFKSWSLPLQAPFTSAIQALSKCHCRCSIYTLMMCFFTNERGSRAALRWMQPVPIVARITSLPERMQPVPLAAACMALLGMK